MQDSVAMQLLWVASGVVTIAAAVLVGRRPRARYVARVAVAALFVVGGALLHVVNLATGADYTGFADPAHLGWVTETWRAVVGPNQVFFIGVLAAFEIAVGVLALVGGRATRLAYVGVIGFYAALCLFGWIEVVWALVMVPAMAMLLRAERTAATAPPAEHAPAQAAEPRPAVGA
jgi:hypothetical protein